MGVSSHVCGYRPADAEWKKMAKIWNACVEAKVAVPPEVYTFFDGEDPENKPGMEVDIDAAVEEISHDSSSGYQVDVTKLPKGVRYVRFENSW